MARRITPAQARSRIRQAQQRQRQAISKHNAAARKYNNAVNNYKRQARTHNAKVRANRHRLQREIQRLNLTSSTRHVVYRRSVVSLTQSYARIEAAVDAGAWVGGEELLDLAEGEAANSVAVLNALQQEAEPDTGEDDELLRMSSLAGELSDLSPDLHARWTGALFALSPRNPDAARHFCTSSREILTSILVSGGGPSPGLPRAPPAHSGQPEVVGVNHGQARRRP